jgi:hypothetical protein
VERLTADYDLSADFDRAAALDDDTASLEILASGMPIDIAREDTPAGHIIRVYPDGHE